MPCPSSQTVSSTPPAVALAERDTCVVAWRTALSTRLPTARSRSDRDARTWSVSPSSSDGCLARTGTRAAAYRSATSARRSAASTSSTRRGPPSSPARASTRRSSTSPDSRCTSGSRPAGRPPVSPTRAATSSWVRMRRERAAQLVGGVGDEGALLGLGRGEPVEHPVEGLGQGGHLVPGGRHGQALVVRRALADPLRAVAQGLDRPQRRADHAPGDHAEGGQEEREEDQQERAQHAPAGLEVGRRDGRPPLPRALLTDPPSTAATSSAPERPVRWPGTVMDPPAVSARQLCRAEQRGEPVGGCRAADDPVRLSTTCTTCAPETGRGSGQPSRVDEGRDLLGAGPRLGLHGAVEGGHHGGVEEQPAQQQRDGDPRQSHEP